MPPTAGTRSARLGLRATPEQETVLRRAAEAAHKSLTDFILDAAYQAAEQTLLDQRLFMVSGSQYQALLARPLGAEAEAFCRRFGFEPTPENTRQLLLLLKDARRFAGAPP